MWAQQAPVNSHAVILSDNSANTDGGAFHTRQTNTTITENDFTHNTADNNGGAMYIDRGTTIISDCKFDHNTAGNDGGVIRSYLNQMNISGGNFSSNDAENDGGVFRTEQSNLTITNQTLFTDNTANEGGVIWADKGTIEIVQTSFTNNTANSGGVMWVDQATITSHAVNVSNNYANFSILYLMESTTSWSNAMFSSNVGSLCAVESIVTLEDVDMIEMQPTHQRGIFELEEGGTITAFQSDITFKGTSTLNNNTAQTGGAIHVTETKVYVRGTITIANNTATQTGGGVYLYQSELVCQKQSAVKIVGNNASDKGGGVHAVASFIKVKDSHAKTIKHPALDFTNNKAEKGGGLYLEMDAKFYVLKSKALNITKKYKTLVFAANSADYGGAVYVSDDGMCVLSTNKECFFQTLALYHSMPIDFDFNDHRCQNIYFYNNTAKISGHSLYGGLLNRCRVSPLAEPNINNDNINYTSSNGTMIVKGLEYLHKISNIKTSDIGSPPVRVCFCKGGQPDCSYQPDPVPIQKSQLKKVPVSLAVLDQIERPLEKAIVYNRLSSGDDLCQHHIQTTDGNCSIIELAASSYKTEGLILFTDGPCKETPDPQVRVMFNVYCPSCPIGFELLEDCLLYTSDAADE